jgi:hypothetical protein
MIIIIISIIMQYIFLRENSTSTSHVRWHFLWPLNLNDVYNLIPLSRKFQKATYIERIVWII